jgi:cyclopropane fatty-acyl-phospholipid synthase-like methyltransferase
MIDKLAFPRTAKYDEHWIRENALGENALCQAECLARHLPFSVGMRVLELGCGKATSSIFLAREFEVQVWATDSGTSATENFQRATALKSATRVFPVRADAHSLPFAREFFDAVVAIDSYRCSSHADVKIREFHLRAERIETTSLRTVMATL